MSFSTDKQESMNAAERFIYPCLKEKFGSDCKILSVEGDASKVARAFDYFGTDLIVFASGALFGVSSRCLKWRDKPTFTVRKTRRGKPAEFYRLKDSIIAGGLYPKYFATCYYKDNSAALGLIETKTLIKHLTTKSTPTHYNGDTEFYAVDWRDVDFERWRIVNGNPQKI